MSLYENLCEAITKFPRATRYELYCHPSVYYAIQRIGDYQAVFSPHPLDMFLGMNIVVAPELGPGVWELYGNGKLVDYGIVRDNDAGLPDGNSGNGKVADA